MADPSTSLTDTTLARLRRLSQGNGLAPDAIALIDSNEQVYTIEGQVQLRPSFESVPRTYIGPAKGNGKNKKVLPHFQAMAAALETERHAFMDGTAWVQDTMHEIEQAAGFGWGMNEAKITLPHRSQILTATEKCPACAGAGLALCQQCHGQKHVICPFCFGKKEEDCYNCFSTGEDPVHKGHPCPVCRGTRFAPCRYCQGTGVMACPNCQGRGGLPCQTCQGTGEITQEVLIKTGATVSFQLANMTDFPSGLLRTMDRVGVPNLAKGHADITLLPPTPDMEKTRLTLRATLPYAEMKIRFANKAALVIAFGKKGYLSGVPPFLDAALAPQIKMLGSAAQGAAPLEKALTARALNDGLKLVLERKTHPNNLRRLYPVGLSAQTATKIMTLLGKALQMKTRAARLTMSIMTVLGSAALFAGLLLPPSRPYLVASLPEKGLKALDVLVPLAALGLTFMLLSHVTKRALQRRYPDVPIAAQDIGPLGYGTLALIVALYVLGHFFA